MNKKDYLVGILFIVCMTLCVLMWNMLIDKDVPKSKQQIVYLHSLDGKHIEATILYEGKCEVRDWNSKLFKVVYVK